MGKNWKVDVIRGCLGNGDNYVIIVESNWVLASVGEELKFQFDSCDTLGRDKNIQSSIGISLDVYQKSYIYLVEFMLLCK